jgi:hypothetical protein
MAAAAAAAAAAAGVAAAQLDASCQGVSCKHATVAANLESRLVGAAWCTKEYCKPDQKAPQLLERL